MFLFLDILETNSIQVLKVNLATVLKASAKSFCFLDGDFFGKQKKQLMKQQQSECSFCNWENFVSDVYYLQIDLLTFIDIYILLQVCFYILWIFTSYQSDVE